MADEVKGEQREFWVAETYRDAQGDHLKGTRVSFPADTSEELHHIEEMVAHHLISESVTYPDPPPPEYRQDAKPAHNPGPVAPIGPTEESEEEKE